MKTTAAILLLIACFFLTPYTSHASEEQLSFKEYLEKANDYIKAYRHFEASDALKEATKLGGDRHPSLHMRLAILYYGLGLIPEAIFEGEKAVALAPSSKWYKYDLAKFYFVDKQYDKAEEMFNRLLQLDPGFTFGYFYLAELFFEKGEYDLAWLSLQRAKKLGHQGTRLEKQLAPLTSKPVEDPGEGKESGELFRFIKLSSPEKAKEVLDKIWNGRLFENLELELKKDKNAEADFGVMVLGELKESVAASLKNSVAYGSPVIIRTGPDYRIMQKILPFHPDEWKTIAQKTPAPPSEHPAVPPPSPEVVVAQAPQATQESPPVVAVSPTPPATESPDTAGAMAAAKDITPQSTDDRGGFSNKLAAFYVLEGWKDSWEAQDIGGYLAAYSATFLPAKGLDRASWEKKRRRSLSRPSFIEIHLEDPVVEMLTPNQLLATFKQSYRSNSYQDVVIKTLTMEKEADGWKITRERVVKKLR